MKRGHSNLYIDRIAPFADAGALSDVAKIPMAGGASVSTVKELPPLALRKAEWFAIGNAMGWYGPVECKGCQQTVRAEHLSGLDLCAACTSKHVKERR